MTIKKIITKYGYTCLVITLFAIGAFLRLYNFENRMIFGPEQGISLMTSAANLEKFSLLGEINLQRYTSTNHNLIHGPLFSYFLLPFILIFNFRILPISLVFPILNLLTAFILFLIIKKKLGRLIAILTVFYFLISSLMIYHSIFIWIYHPLILIGTLIIWFITSLSEESLQLAPAFWLGLLSGIGFNLQYPFLVFAAFLLFLVLIISQKKIASALLFVIGFMLANVTRIIFDLRHDFYHVRTLWQFFLDVYINRTVSAVTYSYHYLHLFPYFCLLLALLSVGIYNLKKPLILIPILIFLYLNLTSPLLNLNHSTGMPFGITLKTLESAANIIAADNPPKRFNLATLWDFDTRANPMRYLLKYYYHLTPQNYENYSDIEAIYAFAPIDYPISDPKVWELRTFLPYKIKRLPSSSPGYILYKLTK